MAHYDAGGAGTIHLIYKAVIRDIRRTSLITTWTMSAACERPISFSVSRTVQVSPLSAKDKVLPFLIDPTGLEQHLSVE